MELREGGGRAEEKEEKQQRGKRIPLMNELEVGVVAECVARLLQGGLGGAEGQQIRLGNGVQTPDFLIVLIIVFQRGF